MEYILGTLASLFAQYLKKRLGTDVLGSYLVILLMSFVAAATYVLIEGTDLWPVLVQTLTVAGAVYAFVIRRFEEK